MSRASRRVRLVLFTGAALVALLAAVVVPPLLRGEATLLSPGPLSAPHGKLEGEENCEKCHVPSMGLSNKLCLECHGPLRDLLGKKRGYHAKVYEHSPEVSCADCHSEHRGLDYQQIRWPPAEQLFAPVQAGAAEPKDFPHEEGTDFPLRGAHATEDCELCHAPSLILSGDVLDQKKQSEAPTFLGLGKQCADCHLDPHVPSQGNDCGECHSEKEWRPAPNFVHDAKHTRFPLEGKHESDVKCEECHLVAAGTSPPPAPPKPHPEFSLLVPEELPRPFRGVGFGKPPARPVQGETLPDCFNCHENPHRQGSPAFGDCKTCHVGSASWAQSPEATFDHDQTEFPLTGKHVEVGCAECHGKALNEPARVSCRECHEDDRGNPHRDGFDREMALAPDETCGRCHDTRSWKEATYTRADHAEVLPLIDGHAVACEACHASDGNAGKQARHLIAAAGFPRLPSRDRRTTIGPLEKDCASCHVDVHEGKLGRDCASCHNFKTFHDEAELSIEGHAELGFVIKDAHLKVDCDGCHGGRNAEGALIKLSLTEVRTQGCVVCHEDEHEGQLGRRCDRCHDEKVWTPSRYGEKAHRRSRFPLLEAHRAVPCEVCHRYEVERRRPPAREGASPKAQRFRWGRRRAARCTDCHEDPHAGQFARSDCKRCHTEQRWIPTTFDAEAHAKTGFPLTGAHDLECSRCHATGLLHGEAVSYAGIPQACAGCHEDVHYGQFAGRKDGCRGCHTDEAWSPTTFDHSKSRFPLLGMHRQTECSACHLENVFEGKKVVHYYPIEERACDDCHVNPHTRRGEREKGGGR
ncbi:MAG: hypothetical protein D6731_06190 [Planctomycetota bacterium]|nr:MAG: hypothetical protein D6731_06190 [Planctomycetota bacterium]